MFALFTIVVIATAGCLKDSNNGSYTCEVITASAPAAEVAALQAYIDSNHIVATKDSRGFFYNIDSSASTSAIHPTTCSDISVAYVAKIPSGKTVDSQSVEKPVSFSLTGNIIAGWKAAIPLMRANSTMNLYLPPSLAYGSTGYGDVPGNSIIVYKNINLLAFAN